MNCSKTPGQLPCARHSEQGWCERIPPCCKRCCMMSQGVVYIRRVVNFITQYSEMWIRNGNEWTRLGHTCRPQWSRSPALPTLQIADQECKRLDHDRVVICSFEHPTTDMRSETLTSVSSRNI